MRKSDDISSVTTFVLSLLLILPAAAYLGFVLQKAWAWFVVPLGVTPIGIWHAVGLATIARLMTYDPRAVKEDEKSNIEKLVRGIVVPVLVPTFALAFAALYHGLS